VLQLDLFREPDVFENQHFVLTVARSHKSTLQGTLKMKQAILTRETAAPEDFLVCSISARVGAGLFSPPQRLRPLGAGGN
jgi:hypothetical protein